MFYAIKATPRLPNGAMASGLPLVAPNSGGIASYAGAANAWLLDPDAGSFASAVQGLVRAPAAAGARCRAARATAELYNWDEIAAGFFDLYDQLHALVLGRRAEPSIAPAFYSTERSGARCQVSHQA